MQSAGGGGQSACAPAVERAAAALRVPLLMIAVLATATLAACERQPLPDGVPRAVSCTSCHGSGDNSAPPRSLDEKTATTDRGVGAHTAHLSPDGLAASLACDECHVVPEHVDDAGHIDPRPAEVVFGPLATAGGLEPVWDRTTATCTNVYCHGATLAGGTHTMPVWTQVDGAQIACDGCHGFPPPRPHPNALDCESCHAETVTASGKIDKVGGHHLDGVVQSPLAAGCHACHGSADNDAPPRSVSGATNTAQRGVGAHQAHLKGGRVRAGIACAACHEEPTAVDDWEHADQAPAEVVFSGLARGAGIEPRWDADNRTCTGVYCHGATLKGGQHSGPIWTRVDGTQVGCDGCHGNPPPPPSHPGSAACYQCHAATVASDGRIDFANGKHIDGVLQAPEPNTCHGCHGGEDNPAPPPALDGAVSTSSVSVGAHQAHLSGVRLGEPVACVSCHEVPADLSSFEHADGGPAELRFSADARRGGVTPAWDRDTRTCSNVYCHGATLPGGEHKTPGWTRVDGSQIGCDGCHGAPPPAPHPALASCAMCHPQTVRLDGSINTESGAHLDGRLQRGEACGDCHGAPPATGSHRVHFAWSARDASYGGLATAAQLAPAGELAMGYAFDCGYCHPTDSARHMNGVNNAGGGTAEIDLSPMDAAAAGTMKARNAPSASYAPGAQWGVDASGMIYTSGGSCSGVSCHSRAERALAPGVTVPEPGRDFAFVGYPIAYPNFDLDRDVVVERQYATPTWGETVACDGCHGLPPRTAYPQIDAAVGDSHSWMGPGGFEYLHGKNMGYAPVACATCHAATVTEAGERSRAAGGATAGQSVYGDVPIADFGRHVNGKVDVSFTREPVIYRSTLDLTTASFDEATHTCSNVACHMNQTAVRWGSPYRFNLWECHVCHD